LPVFLDFSLSLALACHLVGLRLRQPEARSSYLRDWWVLQKTDVLTLDVLLKSTQARGARCPEAFFSLNIRYRAAKALTYVRHKIKQVEG